MTDQTTEPLSGRPFRDEPTEVLETALTLVGADAQHYARTGPKKQEDALHTIADHLLTELQHRGDL
ncbi:hypothetical protein TR631_12585 [Streptomyces rochei]|uniref:hypothetical protein n=1 Tax=Streptomyces rochei TaxID=1928 RepID=UPI002ACEFCAF|nr:hypothetical protein [Streptomyces rochei]WQC12605.1 hypothetical protein TR631_12585 [Streptomyces rochei]